MGESNAVFNLEVSKTEKTCPVGEKVGSKNLKEGKIPVLACEGACIRGEIARVAANLVAKEEPYRRACHGELLSLPHSAIAEWIKKTDKVVLIDGCFLQCHGRILKNLLGEDRLIQFDALSHYKRYTDLFEPVTRNECRMPVALSWRVGAGSSAMAVKGISAMRAHCRKTRVRRVVMMDSL